MDLIYYQVLIKTFLDFKGNLDNVISHLGVVVQLVRTPACHAGGRGFEPRLSRHSKLNSNYEKITCTRDSTCPKYCRIFWRLYSNK